MLIFTSSVMRYDMKQFNSNQFITLYKTRGSLLLRLKDRNDETSWREFYAIYGRIIFGFALRFDLTPTEAEDIVQEVVLKVFRQIFSFHYSPELGRFRGWLKIITRNAVIDFIRRRDRRKNTRIEYKEHISLLFKGKEDSSDVVWQKENEKVLLEEALKRVAERVGEGCQKAFNLFVIKGCSAIETGKLLGMEANAVYACKHRMLKYIREEVCLLERECGDDDEF